MLFKLRTGRRAGRLDAVAIPLFALALAATMALLPAVASAAPYADIVVDANTGEVLHQDSADAYRYPASLTKMMTLYIVFEMLETGRLARDTMLEVTPRAADAQPTKLGLAAGERISLGDGIKALVTKSANDVALTIAENLGGSEEKFARYMTWKARQLGMKNTVFRNASGLPNPAQRTTARDLATLSLRLYDDFPQYWSFFKTGAFVHRGRRYRNHNGLLSSFKGTDGIKTGYTRASGFNLATSAHRDGKHVIGVVLGGRSSRARNARMRELLSKAFAKASTQKTRKKTRMPESPTAKVPLPSPVPKIARPVTKKKLVAAVETERPKKRDLKEFGSVSGLTVSEPVDLGHAGRDVKPYDSSALTSLAAWSAQTIPFDGEKQTRPGKTVVEQAAKSDPAVRTKAAVATPLGTYHIQVGAYASATEAKSRLDIVSTEAPSLIAGHEALTVTYATADRTWFRARFAGFEEAKAKAACQGLKKQRIDCLVMRQQ